MTSDIVGLPIATLSVAVGVLTNTGLTLELALFFGVRRCRPIAAGALALVLVAIGAALGFPLT